MKQYELQGVWRGKGKITTHSRDDQKRDDNFANRNFSAHCPNKLWIADFTYINTRNGWVYATFIIDVFARAIVGWKVSNHMNTDMVMAELNQAIEGKNNPEDVIHHSDIGVRYLFIRYTDRMTEAGNELYKSEVIHYLKESWNGVNDIELATLEWVSSIKSICIARFVMCHLLSLKDGIMIIQPCQELLPD